MTVRLTLNEHTALTFLSSDPDGFTNQIAHACGFRSQFGHLASAKARAMMLRLERLGLAQRMPHRPGCYNEWRITDAGRQAVNA